MDVPMKRNTLKDTVIVAVVVACPDNQEDDTHTGIIPKELRVLESHYEENKNVLWFVITVNYYYRYGHIPFIQKFK